MQRTSSQTPDILGKLGQQFYNVRKINEKLGKMNIFFNPLVEIYSR